MRADVLRHFEMRPGKKMYLHDVAADTGYQKRQVQQALSLAIHRDLLPGLEAVTRGQSWVYTAPVTEAEAPVEEINGFELVTMTKQGKALLMDAEGDFWLAKPLDA